MRPREALNPGAVGDIAILPELAAVELQSDHLSSLPRNEALSTRGQSNWPWYSSSRTPADKSSST